MISNSTLIHLQVKCEFNVVETRSKWPTRRKLTSTFSTGKTAIFMPHDFSEQKEPEDQNA